MDEGELEWRNAEKGVMDILMFATLGPGVHYQELFNALEDIDKNGILGNSRDDWSYAGSILLSLAEKLEYRRVIAEIGQEPFALEERLQEFVAWFLGRPYASNIYLRKYPDQGDTFLSLMAKHMYQSHTEHPGDDFPPPLHLYDWILGYSMTQASTQSAELIRDISTPSFEAILLASVNITRLNEKNKGRNLHPRQYVVALTQGILDSFLSAECILHYAFVIRKIMVSHPARYLDEIYGPLLKAVVQHVPRPYDNTRPPATKCPPNTTRRLSAHYGPFPDFPDTNWPYFGFDFELDSALRMNSLSYNGTLFFQNWDSMHWLLLLFQTLTLTRDTSIKRWFRLGELEIERIIIDARDEKDQSRGARYFVHDGDFAANINTRCKHFENCACWFSPEKERLLSCSPAVGYGEQDYVNNVAFIYTLIAQLAITLYLQIMRYLQIIRFPIGGRRISKDAAIILNSLEKAFTKTFFLAGPRAQDFFGLAGYNESAERKLYLDLDSWLQDCEGEARGLLSIFPLHEYLTKDLDVVLAMILGAVLARRLLALSVSHYNRQHIYARRGVLDFSKLINNRVTSISISNTIGGSETDLPSVDEFLQHNSNYKTEFPRYPPRVIDTQKLEFEQVQSVFSTASYAILSHVWDTDGEVAYTEFNTVMAQMKIQKKIDIIMADLRRFRHDTKLMADLRRLQDPNANPLFPLFKKDYGSIYVDMQKRLVQLLEADEKRLRTQLDVLNNGEQKRYKIETKIKLLRAVETAQNLGYRYLWIDSCCIDRSNNTELAEAISSMGDWYCNANICIVYLEDVGQEHRDLSTVDSKIRWGTRGWTLQEIVMCRRAAFFNQAWESLFSKKRTVSEIAEIARISHAPPKMVCSGGNHGAAASVVMGLAARRQTSRPEDRAYSLMGMLGVRLTPDYGEGPDRAIARLIEAVVHTARDVSVFNWAGEYNGSSVLGRSMFPKDFDAYRPSDINKHSDRNDDSNKAESERIGKPSNSRYFNKIGEVLKPLKMAIAPNLGPMGVNASFEVSVAPVLLDIDKHANFSLETIETIATDKTYGDVECSVICDVRGDTQIKVYCLLSTLKKKLQGDLLAQRVSTSHTNIFDVWTQWVLVRFAGIAGANWFLCEIEQQTTRNQSVEISAQFLLDTSSRGAVTRLNTAVFNQPDLEGERSTTANLCIG
ncbi:hypothetical protein EDC01DRAFT_262729 [Geopyxis carbonaria]|nr:hypothetical protein EDC01DRAFT_262729 [Geopyxis carbonaria]